MKSKYFARGFGVGVLVTSIVFAGFSMVRMNIEQVSPGDTPGGGAIVADNSLDKSEQPETELPQTSAAPDESLETEEAATQTPSEDPSTAPSEAADVSGTSDAHQSDAKNNGAVDSEGSDEKGSGSQNKTDEAGNNQTGSEVKSSQVTVEIPSGYDSHKVAVMLEKEGLVDDADAFDEYLIGRGYENRLCAGTFQIRQGDTYEQIAQKITGRVK